MDYIFNRFYSKHLSTTRVTDYCLFYTILKIMTLPEALKVSFIESKLNFSSS